MASCRWRGLAIDFLTVASTYLTGAQHALTLKQIAMLRAREHVAEAT